MIGQLRFGALSRAGAIGIVAMLLTAVIVEQVTGGVRALAGPTD